MRPGVEAYVTARAWQEDGVWNAEICELPIAVCGDTFEQVQERIEEALLSHMESAKELGVLAKVLGALEEYGRAPERVELRVGQPMWKVALPPQFGLEPAVTG